MYIIGISNVVLAGHWWLTPKEAESGGTQFEANPGK
jgi:hypothetical protein